MNDQVERLAKFMHESHREVTTEQDREAAREEDMPVPSGKPWEQQGERYKERVRYVARAVLAEFTVAVVTKHLPDIIRAVSRK